MIEYQTVDSFFAKGNYHHGGQSVPVQLTGSYKSYSTDPVEIHVWSEEQNAGKIFDSSMSFPYSVWFEGKSETGEPIWMMDIHPNQISGFTHLDASVGVFIKGDLETNAKPNEEIIIHSIITSTPLIIPEWTYTRSYDGTIYISGEKKERNGICWNNNQGKAQLIDNYEYIDGNSDNKEVSLRLRTNSLFLTICPTKDMELKALLFQLPKFLNEDIKLLSFIGRKRIVCTEASARFKSEGKTFFAFARYRTWGGFYSQPSDQSIMRSLIKPKFLQQGLFESLVIKYRESPFKSIIDRTIPYILTSYEDGYLETHLVNAYAALESMVDGISETYNQNNLLGNSHFKGLSKKMEYIIRQEIPDEEIANGIIKKLPELRRRSFLDRLLYLVNIQDINTKLIWPPNTDETFEFHEILKRRNLLIHTGMIGIGNTSEFDLSRVQKLVELWILKLLECPNEAINEYSLWRDAPINSLLHY